LGNDFADQVAPLDRFQPRGGQLRQLSVPEDELMQMLGTLADGVENIT